MAIKMKTITTEFHWGLNILMSMSTNENQHTFKMLLFLNKMGDYLQILQVHIFAEQSL